MKKVIVVYGGGFQPFHQGHMSSYEEAKRAFPNADFYVASSNDIKVRPIPFTDKKFLAQQAGVKDDFVQVKQPVNPEEILRKYNPDQDILILVRSERDPVKYTKKDGSPAYYQPFKNLKDCKPFNPDGGHGYIFVTKKKDFSVAGEVVYSGSQVRKMYSTAKDEERVKIVKDLYPHATNPAKVKKLLDKYIGNMNEELELDEAVLSLSARRERAQRARRMAKRLARARLMHSKRSADTGRLKSRALKMAYKFFRSRLAGGKDYSTLSPGEKVSIDTRLQKTLPAIKKFAIRLIPQERKLEIQRKQQALVRKEGLDLNSVFEAFLKEKPELPQDKDVGDKKGTQPSKYYKGLDKDTKDSRDAHFKSHAQKSDSDPSSYKDAPGDKEAREKGMPQSKHTKKYKDMFGEAADKRQTSRLDTLIRMGLADKALLATLKRSISKLESGETLSTQERNATNDLLQTLLDMVLNSDQLFRLTKTQLQKEDLDEAVYPGNIGAMEMFKFFQQATPGQKDNLKKLIADGKKKDAWRLVQQVTGVKLMGKEFNEEYEDDEVEYDGLQMAKIEVANLIEDAEDLLDMLDGMEEEPEAWVTSKITRAVDYIGTVRDYLDFEDEYSDDEEEPEDDEYDDDELDAELAGMEPADFGDAYEEFKPILEEIDGLKKKAEKSGIPYGILKKVYDRGMAAWKGGHRPGTTPQQWAFARVNSFITKGKGTWGGADKDLASRVNEVLEWGTDEMRIEYSKDTPGQGVEIITARYSLPKQPEEKKQNDSI